MFAVVISVVAIVLGLPGVWLAFRTIRSTTLADRQRAADALAKQLQGVRDEERQRCADRLAALERALAEERQRSTDRAADFGRELAEMAADRDRGWAQRDALQMLINNMRAGRDGGV